MRNRPEDQGSGLLKSMREFLLGFTGYDHSVMALKQKAALDNLMTLIFFWGLGRPANYQALLRVAYAAACLSASRKVETLDDERTRLDGLVI